MANNLVNKIYIAYIITLRCVHCGTDQGIVPHHPIGGKNGKMAGKAADIHAVPMCVSCHGDFHRDPVGWPQMRWIMETQEQAVRDGILVILVILDS